MMALKNTDETECPKQSNETKSTQLAENTTQISQENRNKIKQIKKKTIKQKLSAKFNPSGVLSRNQARRKSSSNLFVPVLPTTILPVSTMATYYPQYTSPILNYPIAVNDWSSVVTTMHLQNHMHNIPFQPVTMINPTPVLTTTICPATTICPYSTALVTPQLLTPVVQQPIILEDIPSTSSYIYEPVPIFSPEQIVPATEVVEEVLYQTNEDETDGAEATLNDLEAQNSPDPNADPLDFYLSLPKELFPTARMLALDPNPIIDEFCKAVNIHSHAPWIFDLEFGIPRVPVTRQIATYNIKFHSVHCKNTPDAIHPGFESCSQEFKRVFLFYYDCIVSAWYRGYMILKYDKSVDNFQSWLLLPMQVLGMCWS